jgi:hypothetical protein
MESRIWELLLTRAQICRWNVIQAKVSKFVGFFAQIERLNQSGKSTEDKVRDAMGLYKAEQREDFKFYTSWTILRNAPKFNEQGVALDKTSSKRKRPTTSASTPSSKAFSTLTPSISPSMSFSMAFDEENDSEGENPITCPSRSSSPLSTSSAASTLAPRPKGKKKAKKDLEQSVLQARQLAATEELTRITKKKVEAMEKSNEIDIMLAKTSDITANAKEYIEIMQATFLAKARREQEAELAGQDI